MTVAFLVPFSIEVPNLFLGDRAATATQHQVVPRGDRRSYDRPLQSLPVWVRAGSRRLVLVRDAYSFFRGSHFQANASVQSDSYAALVLLVQLLLLVLQERVEVRDADLFQAALSAARKSHRR